MSRLSLKAIRRVCTLGRVLVISTLAAAIILMVRVFEDPSRLGTLAASLVFFALLLAFVADRFLCTVTDSIDRFQIGSLQDADPRAVDHRLKDAA